MDGFDGPAFLDELDGEPIKERLIDRAVPQAAKIVCRFHQASSEMPPPNAVDHDSCGKWMFAANQPLRELQPAAALGGNHVR